MRQTPLAIIEINPCERGFEHDIARLNFNFGFRDANVSACPRGASVTFGGIDKLLADANRCHRKIIAVEATRIRPGHRKVADTKIERWVRQPVGRYRRRLRGLHTGSTPFQTRRGALCAFKRRVKCQRLGGKLRRQHEQSH